MRRFSVSLKNNTPWKSQRLQRFIYSLLNFDFFIDFRKSIATYLILCPILLDRYMSYGSKSLPHTTSKQVCYSFTLQH